MRGTLRVPTAVLAVLLLLPVPVRADGVEGDKAVPPGKMARLKVTVPEGAAVLWDVTPETGDVEELDGGRLLLTGPPGVYAVTARVITVVDGKIRAKKYTGTVTVGVPDPMPPGPTPPAPGPGPGPNPQPPPGPVSPQKLFVVVIEETAAAVATRGLMFNDPALSARMKDRGHRWRVVDKDVTGPDGTPPADVQRFLQAAAGKAYPQVFLVNERGQTVLAGDLPKTPADLIQLIQKAGG